MQRIVRTQDNPATPFIYAGRKMGGHAAVEASPLGNPFRLTGKDPEAIAHCLAEYRAWLFAKIKANDPQVMALMREIDTDTTLACYCVTLAGDEIYETPERCHCQVVFKAWKYMQAANLL